jgi:hypothetical protein
MMKKLPVVLLFISTSFAMNAQKDSNYVELGINTLRIVSVLIDDSPSDFDVWNPYMFTLEGHAKHVSLRFGFGQNREEISELPTAANGKVYVKNDTLRTDWRLGVGYCIPLHSKWSLKLGADYFQYRDLQSLYTEYINENNERVTTTREIETKGKGVAPFVHFQFFITPRISLGTELLYRITSAKTSDIDTNNLNENTFERSFETKKNSVMAPTALFLCARF